MSRALRQDTPTPIHDAMVAWTHQAVARGGLLDELISVPSPYVDRARAAQELRSFEQRSMDRDSAVYRTLSDARWESFQQYRVEMIERYHRTIDSPPPARGGEVRKVEWEVPIDSGRGVIVGYVDLRVEVAVPHSWYEYTRFEWETGLESAMLYFEVKPEIPSVGELLRQINRYRHYVKNGLWVVVSPEARFAGLLASQGVKLIVPGPLPELLAESLPS
jgi:hypothetical protein